MANLTANLKKRLGNPEIKFLAVFLLGILGFGLGIVLLAVIVDPYNIFGVNLFKPILLTNRTEKMRLLKEAPAAPEAIILGSSRVFKMDPKKIESLTGLSAFNASVSYARPEEHYALSKYIIEELKMRPKLILVGVNLGEFNNEDIDSQTINNPILRQHLSITKKEIIVSMIRTFKERFNPNYLRDIFITLFWNSHGFPNPSITFGKDGEQIFDQSLKSDPQAVAVTTNLAHDLFNGVETLSPMRLKYFENFLSLAKENDIKVIVFLLPFPPEVHETVLKDTNSEALLAELLIIAKKWEKTYSVDFYNFFKVQNFNGLPDDFDDSTHPSHRNIDLMTEYMLKKFKL